MEDEDILEPDHAQAVITSEQLFDCADVLDILCRREEIAATLKAGRHADAHIRMKEYAKTFASILKGVGEKRTLKREDNVCFHAEVAQMLQTQAAKAKAFRLQNEGSTVDVAVNVDC